MKNFKTLPAAKQFAALEKKFGGFVLESLKAYATQKIEFNFVARHRDQYNNGYTEIAVSFVDFYVTNNDAVYFNKDIFTVAQACKFRNARRGNVVIYSPGNSSENLGGHDQQAAALVIFYSLVNVANFSGVDSDNYSIETLDETLYAIKHIAKIIRARLNVI